MCVMCMLRAVCMYAMIVRHDTRVLYVRMLCSRVRILCCELLRMYVALCMYVFVCAVYTCRFRRLCMFVMMYMMYVVYVRALCIYVMYVRPLCM